MSQRAVVSVEALEREVLMLRSALDAIATAGAALLQGLPMSRHVPLALAQGPILTLAALAETALNAVPKEEAHGVE